MASLRSPSMSLASSITTQTSDESWPATPILLNLPIDTMNEPISSSTSNFPMKIPNQILYQSKPRNFSLPLSKAESNVSSFSPPSFESNSDTVTSAYSTTYQAPKKEEPLDGIRKFFRKRSMSFGLKRGGSSSKNRSEGEFMSSDETVPSVPSTPELLMPLGQQIIKSIGTDGQTIQPDQSLKLIGKEANTPDENTRANVRQNGQSTQVVSTALNETLSTFSFPPPNTTFPYPSVIDTSTKAPISPRTTIVRPQLAAALEPLLIFPTSQFYSSESTIIDRQEGPEDFEEQSLAPASPNSSSFSDELDAEIHFGQAKKLEWSPSERMNRAELWSSPVEKTLNREENGNDSDVDQASDTTSMIDFDFVQWLPSARRRALPNSTSIAGTSRIQASFGSTHRAVNPDLDPNLYPDSEHQPLSLDLAQSPSGSLSWSVSSKSSVCLESPLIVTSSSTSSSGHARKDLLDENLIDSPEQASFTSLTSSSFAERILLKNHEVVNSVPISNNGASSSVVLDRPVRGLGISNLTDDCYECTDTSPLAIICSISAITTLDSYRDVLTGDLTGEDKGRGSSRRCWGLEQVPDWEVVVERGTPDEDEEPIEFDAAVWPMPPIREVWVEKQSGRKNSLLVTPLDEAIEYFPSSGVPLQARERPRRSSF